MKDALLPNENIITTNSFTVGQDCEVPIPGFFIIAPLRKVKSIIDFSDEESVEFIRLVRRVRRAMQEVMGVEEVYLFQNEDTEHGFHLWIFPRLSWMEDFGRKIESVRPIMRHAVRTKSDKDGIQKAKDAAAEMRYYMSGKPLSMND
jgi:diadenosine tetraphosphate (Ap4A) HIT family hydrolase